MVRKVSDVARKRNVVHHFFVLVGDGGNLFRQSEDDVKVFGIEEFGLTILDPLGPRQGLPLWAIPVSTRVVASAFVLALIALFQVTAESGSPAEFDRTHDPALRRGQRSSILFPIGFTVATENVGDFQLGTIHRPALRSTEESPVSSLWELDAGVDRVGWWWSTPCSWQCADTGRW